jgi:ligand-binding SRPBCC domain-containing protein
MTTLEHQVRIEAPLDAVWGALADLTAVRHYNPLVAEVKCISASAEGVGATRRCELKPDGWVEERVWSWNPPHAIGLEVAASTWPVALMKWETRLQADGAATLVTQQLSYRLKLGPLGALLDALVMRRKLSQSLDGVFAGLKRYVEGRRPR